MKIAVITLHRVFNYGSILQTYATQKILEKLGNEVEIIDYITEQRTNKRLFFSVPEKLKNSFIKKYVFLFFRSISIIIRKYTFGSFMKKYINLTKEKYISIKDLKENPPKANVYIVGSDQVWNSKYNEGIDEGFFLRFVSNVPKISFSSSFGKKKLDDWEIEKTQKYLSEFKNLSVREDSAVKIIENLGMNAECIIDPTLQLTKSDWEKLASNRLIKDKYILLMLLYGEDNGATEYARKLADQKGMKLVKISWETKKPTDIDILMTHRSPQDFLSLFLNAECIVTNSFHGLAFSINLNKEFMIFPRNEFNSRIENLLQLTGLTNRMIVDKNKFEFESINYEKVNKIIDKERIKAENFLIKALE